MARKIIFPPLLKSCSRIQATWIPPSAPSSDKAVGDILKRYGDGSICTFGEAQHMQLKSYPTGSLSLDIALGVGGVPRGRITEIYGPESSGKTNHLPAIIAEVPENGRRRRIHIRHGARARSRLRRRVGVDMTISRLTTDTGEQALEITGNLVRSGGVDIVVIDSVAALVRVPRLKATWAMPPWQCRPVSCLRHFVNSSVLSTNQDHSYLHQPTPTEDLRNVR